MYRSRTYIRSEYAANVNLYSRYIKMSSPNMNNLIIAGSMLAYVSVFLLGTDGGLVPPSSYSYICYVSEPPQPYFVFIVEKGSSIKKALQNFATCYGQT